MRIHKQMNNIEISDLLSSIAAAYKIKDPQKNRFRIIAYERAAVAVEHLSSEAKDLWDEGKLSEVSGIGESISEHLGEIFKSGKSKHFDEVMDGVPPATFELLKVSGIGPKTAYRMTTELGIKSLPDLKKSAKRGEISKLEGFGEEREQAILKSISELKGKSNRLLLPYATKLASELVEWLLQSPKIVKAEPLGSLRRKTSTVGDVDIAVASLNAKAAIDHFCNYPHKTRVLEKGERTASIIVPGNRQIDLMVEAPQAFGALLQHFTGSKHHNIALREYALKKGYSLSDYGIKKKGTKKLKVFKSEEQLYSFLGMDYIPPELREGTDEIKAAVDGKLPKLVKFKNIRGDLQIHSSFDIETSHDLGQSTMSKVLLKAKSLGYEYIAFTEHNPSRSKHSKEEIVSILKRKKLAVSRVNSPSGVHRKGIPHAFNSLEIDILPNGDLPVPREGLETLDFALVSIHSSFKQSKSDMTKRVLAGLNHSKVKIFAHPTARILKKREGIELNWEIIFDFCLKSDKWVEINADPARLDLPDHLVRDAVKLGVKLTLGTDSHHVDSMDNMQFGVWVARRGWAESTDIVNTRSLKKIRKMLE